MTQWLVGWKGIARYIKRNWETARKWHRERGLPISRIGNTILGDPKKIDAWIRTNTTKSHNNPKQTLFTKLS